MDAVDLFWWLLPALLLFLVIYSSVRLAIRHEREADRRRNPPA